MAADLFVPPFGLPRAPLPHSLMQSALGHGPHGPSGAGDNRPGATPPPPPPPMPPLSSMGGVHPRPQPSPSMAMAAAAAAGIASTTCSPMFPVLKLDKPVYSSPPPAASNPENNSCKLIEYRGAKVAAFSVDGRELICLPQAFELFLKHLVGGLHTVYTKLKRLDITPIVCNVEQVRILRGLGAIQPGVNRCKLISPKEFDVLYDDCTNSSARPGRPPKRSSVSAMPETLEKLKKSRFEGGDFGYSPNKWLDLKKSPLFGNGYHYPPHLAHMPFMPMGHPAMMNLAMANHLGVRPEGMFLGNQEPRHPSVTDLSSPRYMHKEEKEFEMRRENNNNTLVDPDKPLDLQTSRSLERRQSTTDRDSVTSNCSDGMPNGQMDVNRKPGHRDDREDLNDDMDADDESEEDKNSEADYSPHSMSRPHSISIEGPNGEKVGPAGLPPNFPQLLGPGAEGAAGLSSIETLLLNIQGLLKVAAENARHRETQINFEKAELKMEAAKEREMRENYEKQLAEEHKLKNLLQKRLRKEKKARRRLQEQMEIIGDKSHQQMSLPPCSQPSGALSVDRGNDDLNSSHESHLNSDHLSHDSDSDHSIPPSPVDERKYPDPPRSTSSIQNLMDTFLNTQSKSSPPPTLANGYIHSPVIKSTVETV